MLVQGTYLLNKAVLKVVRNLSVSKTEGRRLFIVVALMRMTAENLGQGRSQALFILHRVLPQRVMEVISAHPASNPRSHARFVLGDFSQLQISYALQLMCSCCSCSPVSRDGHISFCQELNQNTNRLPDINKAAEAAPESHLCPSGSFLLLHLMDPAMLSPVCNTHAAYNPFLSS